MTDKERWAEVDEELRKVDDKTRNVVEWDAANAAFAKMSPVEQPQLKGAIKNLRRKPRDGEGKAIKGMGDTLGLEVLMKLAKYLETHGK